MRLAGKGGLVGARRGLAACAAATSAPPATPSPMPPPEFTRGWEPQSLWAFFEQLTRIPRASKHEEAITGWI